MTSSAWQQQGWSAPPLHPAAMAPQPAPWSAPTHPGPRTSTLAILAIIAAASGTTILLGVGSIAAIVLGAIALAQIRRTGEDGRLLALWAIILGGVTIAALALATITGIAMIVELVGQVQQGR